MTIRQWWDSRATALDQVGVLGRVGVSIGYAGLPWVFLPAHVQTVLTRRVQVTLPDDE